MWLWAAGGILLALLPCAIRCFRGTAADRLASLETASALATLELLLLAQAVEQPSFFDLGLTLALLSFGGGMVFARYLERWS